VIVGGISKYIFLDLNMSEIAKFVEYSGLYKHILAISEHSQKKTLRFDPSFFEIFKNSDGHWC